MRKGEGDSQRVEVLHGRSVLLLLLLFKLLHCRAIFRPSIRSEDDFEELPASNVGVEAMPLCDSEVPATDRERESLEEVRFCKDLPRMDEERVDIPDLEDREWLLGARACASEFLRQEDAVVARALLKKNGIGKNRSAFRNKDSRKQTIQDSRKDLCPPVATEESSVLLSDRWGP